ncbi:MAG TPA: cytochrome c oxidase assembly protein [Stellaceae bacterium]|nr:cytochrome c oxidase assembly protein [Stellaceae bacterium]
MSAPATAASLSERAAAAARWELAFYGVVIAPGAALFWLSTNRPALAPSWAPWDFSWLEYLAVAFPLAWFCRGLVLSPPEERLPLWRVITFIAGIAAIYGVLQTHFDYMAQHMFFLNRAQHVVMHHLGPFLIALGWVGGTIKRGMPAWAQRAVESRFVSVAVHVLQQPVLAVVLFVGLFALWLIPPVHFRAMLDPQLYEVMNWSMVLDGVLFWCLVLDPRPAPPARIGFGIRAALAIFVMFPQIVLGAVITFSPRDLYPFYDVCGRLFPSISALSDQHIGGIVSWIPPAMMSVVALLLVLNALRRAEDAAAEASDDQDAAALAAMASRWTGL